MNARRDAAPGFGGRCRMPGETRPDPQTVRVIQGAALGFVTSLLVLLLGSVFFSLVAGLEGDTKASHYHPGDPLPWWRAGQHQMVAHLLLIMLLFTAIGALLGWLRAARR
jgi:hypothetical protein